MKNQSTWTGERGAEHLEFTFVVVLLLTMIFGIFWFARAYNVHQTMTRAAREGARMAALPSSFADGNSFLDSANVTKSESVVFANHIAPVLLSANLDPDHVTGYSQQVRWLNPGDTNQQCGVVISFSYPFTFHIPFTPLNLATIHLSTQVQMRRENQPLTGTCP
jgi:Flp pilus assembly protein TadG